MMEHVSEAVKRFDCEIRHNQYVAWWTGLRLTDCKVLVYQHAVIECSCGRLVSEAYQAWREQHPIEAKHHDRILEERAREEA